MGVILAIGGIRRWAAALLLTAWTCWAPAAEQVTERVIGASPAQAFYLVEVFRALLRSEEAELLARYLLHAYVDELEGKRHDPAIRVADALLQAQQLPDLGRAVDLRRRWRAHVARALEVTPAQSPRPLPGELETMAGQLVPRGPGLWAALHGEHPRILYLSVTGRNTAEVPLPVDGFDLSLATAPGVEPLKLRCAPEAPRIVRLLQQQETAPFLCQSFAIPPADERWDAFALLAQARTEPRRLQVDARQLDELRSVQEVVKALASLRREEAEKLITATAPPPAAVFVMAVHDPRVASAQRGYARVRLLYLLGAIAILGTYFLLAQALGNRRAAVLLGVGGTILVALAPFALGGFPSDPYELMASGIAYAMALVLPGSAAAVLHAVYSGYEYFRDDKRPFQVKAIHWAVGLLVCFLLFLVLLDD